MFPAILERVKKQPLLRLQFFYFLFFFLPLESQPFWFRRRREEGAGRFRIGQDKGLGFDGLKERRTVRSICYRHSRCRKINMDAS
jgi:hypothetical protein